MDGPVQTVNLPQWTHADLPPGEQAALIAAKMRMQYAGVLPAQAPKIAMYTGDLYEVFEHGDGRWGARLIAPAGPDGVVGSTFVARHGVEHESWPEISTKNIRAECGVVKLEERVGGHDEDIATLKKTVKRLEAELAQAREQIRGIRGGLLLPLPALQPHQTTHVLSPGDLEL